MDDFGEMAAGAGAMDIDFADFGVNSSSNLEEARREASIDGPLREMTPFLDGSAVPNQKLFNTDDDFGGDLGPMDDDVDSKLIFNRKMEIFSVGFADMAGEGAAMQDDLQIGAAANNFQAEQESFALEPLEAGALDRQPRRHTRKRKLIIDEQKNISGEEMKNNMADFT